MRQAGKRDQRVQIEALQVGKGESGGMQKTWVSVAEVWGSVRHLSGHEKRATDVGGLVAEARTEIEILYRPGVTATMRVVHRGTRYNIVHVNNLQERNQALVLTCDSGVNHG
ncbi:phage head closure protein [Xylophilus sp. Leaf220]|uniref:phage head closure protein n=1 Tax=Xylophilus sp. Leaf220 TaxID=1735686 RepID=UPI000701734E|nr:phage head closure protein [Xylophilus sp. Leaf220]KQM79822.1 hypothetical protein ASE76_01045 [Xylophilus sp. Leaf220]